MEPVLLDDQASMALRLPLHPCRGTTAGACQQAPYLLVVAPLVFCSRAVVSAESSSSCSSHAHRTKRFTTATGRLVTTTTRLPSSFVPASSRHSATVCSAGRSFLSPLPAACYSSRVPLFVSARGGCGLASLTGRANFGHLLKKHHEHGLGNVESRGVTYSSKMPRTMLDNFRLPAGTTTRPLGRAAARTVYSCRIACSGMAVTMGSPHMMISSNRVRAARVPVIQDQSRRHINTQRRRKIAIRKYHYRFHFKNAQFRLKIPIYYGPIALRPTNANDKRRSAQRNYYRTPKLKVFKRQR